MKVSVIVPIYNTPRAYLRDCISSLLAQTLEEMEIILVNDASTDDTLDYLRQWEASHRQKIKVIDSPENRRQGGARNLGIRAATGEYIAFVDSDDMVQPHTYETLYNKAKDADADTVLCRWKRFSDADAALGESSIPEVWRTEEKPVDGLFLNPQSVCCKLYRRSIVVENNVFFPEKMFYEDNAWCPLCMMYVEKAAYVDEALYQYRLNAGSTTEGGDFSKYMDRCRAAIWLNTELENRGLYSKISEAADFWFFHCFWVSCAKMCVAGFGRTHFNALQQLRKIVFPKRRQYFSNRYYKMNIRNYEQEDIIYHKLLMYAPVTGIAVIKTINLLRKLKHGSR